MKRRIVFTSLVVMTSLILPSGSSDAIAGSSTVTVFAASSLTKAFNALGAKFQMAHAGVTIRFSYGSSSTLATQISAGAPADLFASADIASMSSVRSEVPHPIDYVVNQVVVAVSRSSKITKLTDLNSGTKWLQCGHTVPCGIAADAALKAEGSISSSPVSLESTDASAAAKLLAGSVDAAIIYKTDVIANPTKLRALSFSNSSAASTQYQLGISTLSLNSKNHWAQTFFRYLNSHDAKQFLTASGFAIPQ
jgi:molybdate transport system substrate-binding protein